MKSVIFILIGALLIAVLTGCSTFLRGQGGKPEKQQCVGIHQKLIFADSSLNINNTSRMQIEQKKQILQQQYNNLNCDQVLN